MRLIYWLNFLVSFGYNLVSKILPAYLTKFTQSAFQISFVGAAYQLAKVLGAPFLGIVSDKLGKKRALTFALLILAILGSSLIFLDSIFSFVLIFFAIGLVSNLLHISLNAICTILSEKKAEALSKLEISYQIGFIAGPMLGGFIALLLGMPVNFVIWALISLTGLVSVQFIKETEPIQKVTVKSTLKNVGQAIRNNFLGFLVFFIVGGFFIGFIEGTRDILIPLYAHDLGYSLLQIGLIFTISSIITALGLLPFGKLSDKAGRGFALLSGIGLIIVSYLLLGFTTAFLGIALLTGILSLGRTVGLTTTRAFASDITTKESRATGISLFEITFSLGRVVGPVTGGLLKDFFAIKTTFAIIISISVVAALIMIAYLVKIKRRK